MIAEHDDTAAKAAIEKKTDVAEADRIRRIKRIILQLLLAGVGVNERVIANMHGCQRESGTGLKMTMRNTSSRFLKALLNLAGFF